MINLRPITDEDFSQAEFRIAVHPHRTGVGLGREITINTLKKGFQECGMNRIYLIVRKNNYPAIKVYERPGFKRTGESVHAIEGHAVHFFDMDINAETFHNLHAAEAK